MRTIVFLVFLFNIPVLFAERPEQPSTRRRPKSIPRVYDQRATVVDMEALFQRGARETEDALSRDALRDSRPRGSSRPVPAQALPQPSMTVFPAGSETPSEEEENLPWLRPIDLLGEDEFGDRQTDEEDDDLNGREARGEEPPLDWDRLGEGFVEMETREAPPPADEESEAEEREAQRTTSLRERELRALSIEPVIREASTPASAQNGRESERGETRAQDFSPAVPANALLAVPQPRVQEEEADPVELPGSRALFQESFQRLERQQPNPFRSNGETSRFAPAPRPEAPSRSPRMETSFSPPASALPSSASPAPLTARPSSPAQPSLSPAPRPVPATSPSRSDLMDMRRFRQDDYRIRPGGDRF